MIVINNNKNCIQNIQTPIEDARDITRGLPEMSRCRRLLTSRVLRRLCVWGCGATASKKGFPKTPEYCSLRFAGNSGRYTLPGADAKDGPGFIKINNPNLKGIICAFHKGHTKSKSILHEAIIPIA